MLTVENLCKFLVKAKKSTYAAWDKAQKFIEKDNSTSLVFKDWEWKYHDNYFGGEPFGGREVVFLQNKPIYLMTYYGWVNPMITDFGEIYSVLQKALLLLPPNSPYRGPEEFVCWDYIYLNNFKGEIDNFSWEEVIKIGDRELYRAKYMWWFVDRMR